jgi:hypothetical protein
METCESHGKQRIFLQNHLLTGFYQRDSASTYEAGIELLNIHGIIFYSCGAAAQRGPWPRHT